MLSFCCTIHLHGSWNILKARIDDQKLAISLHLPAGCCLLSRFLFQLLIFLRCQIYSLSTFFSLLSEDPLIEILPILFLIWLPLKKHWPKPLSFTYPSAPGDSSISSNWYPWLISKQHLSYFPLVMVWWCCKLIIAALMISLFSDRVSYLPLFILPFCFYPIWMDLPHLTPRLPRGDLQLHGLFNLHFLMSDLQPGMIYFPSSLAAVCQSFFWGNLKLDFVFSFWHQLD